MQSRISLLRIAAPQLLVYALAVRLPCGMFHMRQRLHPGGGALRGAARNLGKKARGRRERKEGMKRLRARAGTGDAGRKDIFISQQTVPPRDDARGETEKGCRMGLEIGAVIEGKVTGITKFGAFVALPEGKSGLVHISEVANSYVNDVNDYLSVGQTVKVRVISINEAGKINLSVKQAQPAPPAPPRRRARAGGAFSTARAAARGGSASADKAFEDRLKKFMQESDSRIADNRMYSERRQRSRRK